MEEFPIFIKTAPPIWEALPLGKLVSFPKGTDIYSHIYAQMQIYFQEGQGLHLHMLSFESSPPDDSSLSFMIFTNHGRLNLSFSKTGLIDPPPASGLRFSPFQGEDLQGVFWGANLFIPQAELESHLGKLSDMLKVGHILGQSYNNTAIVGKLFKSPHGRFVFSKYETKERI